MSKLTGSGGYDKLNRLAVNCGEKQGGPVEALAERRKGVGDKLRV